MPRPSDIELNNEINQKKKPAASIEPVGQETTISNMFPLRPGSHCNNVLFEEHRLILCTYSIQQAALWAGPVPEDPLHYKLVHGGPV